MYDSRNTGTTVLKGKSIPESKAPPVSPLVAAKIMVAGTTSPV